MSNYSKIVAILLTILLTTGCWDRVEIDQRGFVVGAAIDKAKTKNTKGTSQETSKTETGSKQYAVTYQFVIPSAAGESGGGQGKGGGSESNTYKNETMEGDTIFEITREMATKVSRTPYFEHIKTVIVSEEVAKSGTLPDVLDFFFRDPEMRRGTLIMIAQGEAKKILEVKSKTEKFPVLAIQSVARNYHRNARMMRETRIGDIQKYFLLDFGYVLPRVVGDEKQIRVSGAYVFQGGTNKLVGSLNEKETEGINFLTGDIKSGLIKISVGGALDVYEIKSSDRAIKVDATDPEHLKFVISIQSEGDLGEAFKQQDYLKMKTLNGLEKKVEEQIEGLVGGTIQKMQKGLKVDGLGLGEYLKSDYPKVWNNVKNDWDKGKNYFAQSDIEVQARVKIRNIGSVSHTERED